MSARRVVVSGLAIGALVAAGAAGAVIEMRRGGGTASAAGSHTPAATAAVTRADLVTTENVSGTLGYTGTHEVTAQAHGTLTWLAPEGSTVSRGQTLYELDGKPVVLMYGARPAWRTLSTGIADGPDVQQLDENLIALGFASAQNLTPSNTFTDADAAAVKRWQKALGVDQTGSVELGSVIFLPGPIRIAQHKLDVGAAAGGGAVVSDATDTTRGVSVALDVAKQALVKNGDSVSVQLPNGATVQGTVTSVASVAKSSGAGSGGSSTTTIDVTVGIVDQSQLGSLDSAPVEVAITTQSARGVLAVPITALTVASNGGYAVDLVDNGSFRRVAVTTGLFSNSMVEVNGEGLREGQLVEVPSL